MHSVKQIEETCTVEKGQTNETRVTLHPPSISASNMLEEDIHRKSRLLSDIARISEIPLPPPGSFKFRLSLRFLYKYKNKSEYKYKLIDMNDHGGFLPLLQANNTATAGYFINLYNGSPKSDSLVMLISMMTKNYNDDEDDGDDV